MKASGPARPLAVFAKLQTRILRPVYRDDGCLRRYTSCSRERPPVPTWMKTDRAAFSRATVSRLNERAKRWNGTLGKADGEDGPPTNSVDRKLSAEGQALYKRFVHQDRNNADEKILIDNKKEWKRAQDMDAFAFQLIRAHEGSLELEAKYKASGGNLDVGTQSKNGAVEHLGAGVFLEKDTPGIDDDSRRKNNSATITRIDLRAVANDALNEFKEPTEARNVAVIGYPGTGKTRGGLTYALQTLLWRGEAVLRVGYNDNKVYAFLPNENGTYEVWSTTTKDWPESEIADSRTAYALIDPSDRNAYDDQVQCKMLKFASNNYDKHYENLDKGGTVLIASMPTVDEVLAMTEVLWNEYKTPIQFTETDRQTFNNIKQKKDEIRDRCALVGCSLRIVFSGDAFRETARRIMEEARGVAFNVPADVLSNLFLGNLITSKTNRASSVKSTIYELNPQSAFFRKVPRVQVKPLVKYIWKKEGEQKTQNMNVRSAFVFEDFCAMLMRGGTLDGTTFPSRNLQQTLDNIDAINRICQMRKEGGSVVVAPWNLPVLDFATSLYTWYNAKVGKTVPVVYSGAFTTLMLDLGLAQKVNGKLVMNEEHKEARITLTMLRNFKQGELANDNYKWVSNRGKNHDDLDPTELAKFFREHVDVKVLDTSKWTDSESENREKVMTRLLVKYRLPVFDVATEDALAEDVSTEDAPTEDVSTEDALTDDVSTEGAPTDDVSTEDAPTENVSTEGAPTAPTENVST